MYHSLKFSEHISEKVNKAIKDVGIIISRTSTALDANMFKLLLCSPSSSLVGFAYQVQNPILGKDVKAAEKVQRRATRRLLPNMNLLTCEERLRALKLSSLSYRSSMGDLIEMSKIIIWKYDKEWSEDVLWGVSKVRRKDIQRSCLSHSQD